MEGREAIRKEERRRWKGEENGRERRKDGSEIEGD